MLIRPRGSKAPWAEVSLSDSSSPRSRWRTWTPGYSWITPNANKSFARSINPLLNRPFQWTRCWKIIPVPRDASFAEPQDREMWGRSGNVAWLARHCQHDERAHQNAQLHSTADPGELLAGLEASINMFRGVSRPTSTWNSKRNKAGHADPTHYEDAAVEQILRNCRNPQGQTP